MILLNLSRRFCDDFFSLQVLIIKELEHRPYLCQLGRRILELCLEVLEREIDKVQRGRLNDLVCVEIFESEVTGAVLEFRAIVKQGSRDAELNILLRDC